MSTDVDEFEQWWEVYRSTSERSGSKGAASKSWDRLKRVEKNLALIAIHRHRGYLRDFPGRFVMPNGSTWLNQRRWQDEAPQEPPRRSSSRAMDHLRSIHGGVSS